MVRDIDKPHELSPLVGLAVPSTMDEVCMQMEMLLTHYDTDIAHREADRLLLMAIPMYHNLVHTEYEALVARFLALKKYYA